jgi:glycosyltransferase involved in cell wall biosynthesis
MKILFITPYYSPHIGGVEKHVKEIAKHITKKGPDVTVLTSKHDKKLKVYDVLNGIEVIRFKYPKIKYLGLLTIWKELFKNRNLIKSADVIHIHDVFIWYLPFRFLYPKKKVITTLHGWEGEWPIPINNLRLKKLAQKYSDITLSVGKYIEWHYGIVSDKIIYGATDIKYRNAPHKVKGKIAYVGRLDKDTGLIEFIKSLKESNYKNVVFVGDGKLKNLCKKYGKVTGFTDPAPYLKSAEYAVPAGYLSYIDAVASYCKIITFADNPLKEDYWKEIKKIKKFPTWEMLTNEYINLYNNL